MKNSTIFTFPIRRIDPHFQQNDKTPSLSSEDRKTYLASSYKAEDLRALPQLNKKTHTSRATATKATKYNTERQPRNIYMMMSTHAQRTEQTRSKASKRDGRETYLAY
ncbi:hypothetical protein VV97_21765 [Vibrio vulnificus]|nr:hypothetical protein VV97_21765 [Vibrio vulnificus]